MRSNDTFRDRVESAQRMCTTALQEYTKGHQEDALEFLAAAERHIKRARDELQQQGHVVNLPRKEASHAR